jgi:hypothetical protein
MSYPILSGIEFNKLYGEKTFVKLTNKTENHRGFQYKDGLNIDTNEFGIQFDVGLFFTEYDKIYKWIEINYNYSHSYYRIVTIPDYSQVCIDYDAYKTDKFILGERKEIFNDYIFCENIIKKKPSLFQYIPISNQTENICELALESIIKIKNYNYYIIKFITDENLNKEKVHNMIKNVLKVYAFAILYIKNPTEEMYDLAIERNYQVIEFINNENIINKYIQKDGLLLRFIRFIKLNKHTYKYKFLREIKSIPRQTERMCLLAVKQNGLALQYVNKQTEEICITALLQNYHALKYVPYDVLNKILGYIEQIN